MSCRQQTLSGYLRLIGATAIAAAAVVIWTGATLGGVAMAGCNGRDLIAALPQAERAELTRMADAVPFARGNLWRATRGQQVIHLVGTYHFTDSRHDATLARIEPLLDTATVLLVEAGPDEERLLATELAQRPDFMFLTNGPTLPEILPEADWQAVIAAMRARGVPAFLASKFRPWYMAMMLNLPPCAMPDIQRGAKGLDHMLIASATRRGVPVRALEPFDTLFSIFGTLSMAEEIDMIGAALHLADRAEDMTATLANAYFAGQSRLIWEFTLMQARSAPGMSEAEIARQFALTEDVLMTARNKAWVPVLLAAAEQGDVLAAFGALHLPGHEGVLALLQAEGFVVNPLKN
ncbi:MAG: TraB/GumN family protein [Gemmobacter sp.]|nr:TraB/GumN family protein [Gemmobacter sp.]